MASTTAAPIDDPNLAAADGSTSIRSKRGVELWLETSSPDSSPKPPASPPPQKPTPPPQGDSSSAAPRSIHSASTTSAPSIVAAPPAAIEGLSMDEQLKLLKEKRRTRSNASSSSVTSGDAAAAPATPVLTTPIIVVPPIDLTANTAGKPPTGSAGKPPLSSRRTAPQLVHVPRSGRGEVPSTGPTSSARGAPAPPPLPTAADVAKAVADLNTGEWQKQTESLDIIKTALGASSSPTDDTRVKLRQLLHALVTGTLAAMDSQRSTVSKSATDAISVIAQKLGNNSSTGEGNSLDHFADAIVNKIVTRGGSVSSRFLFDSAGVGLRELILATKPPKALAALLNLPSPPKVDRGRILWCEGLTNGVENAPPGILTAKNSDLLVRVIRAAESLVTDANGEVREVAKKLCQIVTQYCRESKDNLRSIATKSLSTTKADHFLTFCIAVQATDAELVATPPALVSTATGAGSPPGGGAASAAPPVPTSRRSVAATPPTSGRASNANTNAPAESPPATLSSTSKPANSAAAPPSSSELTTSTPQQQQQQQRSLSPNEVAALPTSAQPNATSTAAAATNPRRPSPPSDVQPAPAPSASPTSTTASASVSSLNARRMLSTPTTSPTVSPAKGDSHGRSPQFENLSLNNDSFSMAPPAALGAPMLGTPGSSTPREGSLAPGASSPRMYSSAMSPRPGTNGSAPDSSFFGGTLARDMKEEHGVYSQSLFLAAEGTSGDRAQALSNITVLLRKHLQDPATATSPISNVATCFALCDVIALRCADTSNKVQVAALELVLPLFRCVPISVVDSTSPRWVSCLSTALGSSYVAVRTAASNSLTALLTRSSESNLRNMCQTICMTSSTVRNVATKVELLNALVSILRRHHFVVSKRQKEGDDDILGTSFTMNSSNSQLPGLTRSDLDFCTETALRVWCSDVREEVRKADAALLCSLMDFAWDGDEGKLLDNPRVDPVSWTAIKGVLDTHRAQREATG